MRPLLSALTLTLALALASAPAALAQGAFGIGGQGGDPTGVTVRLGPLDAAAGLDFGTNRQFFVQAHYLLDDRPVAIEDIPVRFFYGLGAFVGGEDLSPGRRVYGGVSSVFGLSYYALDRFEIFGQVTPRLRLAPNTTAALAPALGIRFYP